MLKTISYIPRGTCTRKIDVKIKKNMIESVEFLGGCPGNLLGITHLVKGMEIEEVLLRIEGVRCGRKNTSCPDQLARALRSYLEQNNN